MNLSKSVLTKGLVIFILLVLIISIFSVIPVTAQDVESNETSTDTQAEGAYFTEDISDHGLDINENELFDHLILELTLIIKLPGAYELGSELRLGEDHPIIYVYKTFETDQDKFEIDLKFNGEQIFDSGFSGSLEILLWLESEAGETIDKREYKTEEYRHTQFEHSPPPIKLTEKYEVFGNDTDRNGIYEFLSFDLEVEVIEPGPYSILGGLFKNTKYKIDDTDDEQTTDKDMNEEDFYFLITHTSRVVKFREGINHLRLNFKGPQIYLTELNGPYEIGLWIAEGESQPTNEEDPLPEDKERELDELNKLLVWPMAGEDDLSGDITFETKDHAYTDFESPPEIVKFNERIIEKVLDFDDNGLYDVLKLSVGLNVTEPGGYILEGKIISDSNWFSPIAENLTHLRTGQQMVNLHFRGIEIHKSKLDGHYYILITLRGKSADGFPVFESLKYQTTKKYSHKDFESGLDDKNKIDMNDGTTPYANIDLEGITTKTNVLETHTARSRPEITFWYADTEGSGAKFRLEFHRLIGYKDLNLNGRYDFGEERFESFLADNLWEVNDLANSVNSEYGNYVEFQLSSNLNLYHVDRFNERPPPYDPNVEKNDRDKTKSRQTEPNDRTNEDTEKRLTNENKVSFAQNWARLAFTFLITSNDFTINEPLSYRINGGTELKIDITLEFYRLVDIDGICLEQILFDEANIYGLKTKEATREWVLERDELNEKKDVYRPAFEPGEMQLFEPRSDESKQWIMFIDDNGKEFGFYSWVNSVNLTYSDGSSEVIEIQTTYVSDGNALRLFANYPYTRTLQAIHHDPSVGMIEESKPSRRESVDDLAKMLFNPLLYIIACVGAIIFIGFLRKSQMKRKNGFNNNNNNNDIPHEPRTKRRPPQRYRRPPQKFQEKLRYY